MQEFEAHPIPADMKKSYYEHVARNDLKFDQIK